MGLDLIIVLLLAGGFVLGFFRGAMRQLSSIGAWLISFLLAAHLAAPMGRWLAEQAPTYSVEYSTFLSFGAIFLLLITAGALLFQVAGSNVSLTRNELVDDVIGGVLGALLVLLVVAALVVVLDSYFSLADQPLTAEFQLLRETYNVSLDSAIANTLRNSLIPLIGTLLNPILPHELRAVMA